MSTPESKENIQIGFFIRKSTLEKVNMLTKKAGVSRNRLLSNICDVGVDELMMYDSVGVFTLARVINQWKEDRRQGSLELQYRES